MKTKENLFIKSAQRDKLLDAARAMVPPMNIIIKELYNEVYKKDIEECLTNHFGYKNDIDIYVYQNYYDCLTLVLVIKDKDNKQFMSNFVLTIDDIIDDILQRHCMVSLFSNFIDSHCEILENIEDLTCVNGLVIKVK